MTTAEAEVHVVQLSRQDSWSAGQPRALSVHAVTMSLLDVEFCVNQLPEPPPPNPPPHPLPLPCLPHSRVVTLSSQNIQFSAGQLSCLLLFPSPLPPRSCLPQMWSMFVSCCSRPKMSSLLRGSWLCLPCGQCGRATIAMGCLAACPLACPLPRLMSKSECRLPTIFSCPVVNWPSAVVNAVL